MELHEIVKKHRKQKGLTQSQLAEKLDVTERTVSRAETGATKSRPLLLMAARVLGVPDEDLQAATGGANGAVPGGRMNGGVVVTDPDGRMFIETPDGTRAELEDDEPEEPKPAARPRHHWFQNGIQVARFIMAFEPHIRVEDPPETDERHDAIRQLVRCSEELREGWRHLSDVEMYDAEQAIHGAWVRVNEPVESHDDRKLAWCISGTSNVTQKIGPDGKSYDIVEATLIVELSDYTDAPF